MPGIKIWALHPEKSASHPLWHVDEYLAIGESACASDIHLGVNAPHFGDCAETSNRSGRTCRVLKAIDKNPCKKFLPPEEEHLGDAAGAVPDDEQ